MSLSSADDHIRAQRTRALRDGEWTQFEEHCTDVADVGALIHDSIGHVKSRWASNTLNRAKGTFRN